MGQPGVAASRKKRSWKNIRAEEKRVRYKPRESKPAAALQEASGRGIMEVS
jgi:hypothetical protein